MGRSCLRLLGLFVSVISLFGATMCGRPDPNQEGPISLLLSAEMLFLGVGQTTDISVILRTSISLPGPLRLSVTSAGNLPLPMGLVGTFDPQTLTPTPDRDGRSRLQLQATPQLADEEYPLVLHARGTNDRGDVIEASSVLRVIVMGKPATWQRPIRSDGTEQVSSLAPDSEGGVTVGFYSTKSFGNEPHLGDYDGYVLRYKPTGAVAWATGLGTSASDIIAALTTDVNDHTYVAGYTYGTFPGQVQAGKADGFVAKIDRRGQIAWLRQIGTPEIDQFTGIAVGADGSVHVAGLTEGAFAGQTNEGGLDFVAWKLSPQGETVWIKQLGTPFDERTNGVANERSVGIAVDAKGGVYVAGSTQGQLAGETAAGLGDAVLWKLDADGKQAWTRQVGSGGDDALLTVAVHPNGDVYAAGWARGPIGGQVQAGGQDGILLAYSPEGVRRFVRQIGTSYADSIESLSIGPEGKLFFTGSTRGAFAGQSQNGVTDVYFVQASPTGSIDWLRQFGSPQSDRGTAIARSGSFVYLAGTTFGDFDTGNAVMQSDGFVHQFPLP